MSQKNYKTRAIAATLLSDRMKIERTYIEKTDFIILPIILV